MFAAVKARHGDLVLWCRFSWTITLKILLKESHFLQFFFCTPHALFVLYILGHCWHSDQSKSRLWKCLRSLLPPPLRWTVSLAGLLRAEGLCADVLGERPAPLPWENMWSGSVYAGALSSCLPHSMLASVSLCLSVLSPSPVTKGAFSG